MFFHFLFFPNDLLFIVYLLFVFILYIYNEGCLKGIPPSTYLRIIKVLFRHTLGSKKYSKNSMKYMENGIISIKMIPV